MNSPPAKKFSLYNFYLDYIFKPEDNFYMLFIGIWASIYNFSVENTTLVKNTPLVEDEPLGAIILLLLFSIFSFSSILSGFRYTLIEESPPQRGVVSLAPMALIAPFLLLFVMGLWTDFNTVIPIFFLYLLWFITSAIFYKKYV